MVSLSPMLHVAARCHTFDAAAVVPSICSKSDGSVAMMMNEASVRFWQPAPEAGTELVCAYLETSEGPPHLHEEWQFGVLEVPSKLSLGAYRRCSVQEDDVTIVSPYDVHSEKGITGMAPSWRMLYVAPSIVSQLNGRKAPCFRQSVVTDPAASAELREMLRQSEDGSIAGSEFLRRVTSCLERCLARHAGDIATPQSLPGIERVRAYLQNRPTETVSLPELGAMAGITLSRLARSFSRAVGLPPGSYHAHARLAHARRLLAEGKSATWVAYECGFADQSHLSRRFKECHGVTPGAFQAQYCSQRSSLIPTASTAA
jgi:AraC-like DNA-binding protein